MSERGSDRDQGWLTRLLLRVYPRCFRARFGIGMGYALESDRRAARRAGPRAHAVYLFRTIASMLAHGGLERWRALHATRRADSGDEHRRPSGGDSMLDSLSALRLSVRRLVRRPGFSLTVVVTLALGIGATTVIFAFVDAIVLRPLPYPDPDRLVRVGHRSPGNELGIPSAGYLHYSDRSRSLADIALFLESSASIAGLGRPLEVGLIQATPNLLRVLGVRPMLGRALTEDDNRDGAPPVTLVTHGYWTRMLGADSAAIGKPVLEGDDLIVVGVMPPDFTFARPEATTIFGNRIEVPDLILPLGELPREGQWFGNFMYQAVARLVPGVRVEDAQAELDALMLEAAETYPGGFTPQELTDGGYRPVVIPIQDAIVGDLESVLWILFGAVGFVLLIATANVANLALVRAESRRGEVAVRRALGASTASLARSILSESALLGLVGGALGALLALAGTRVLLALAPTDIPRIDQVGIDVRVLAFAGAVSILAGLAFGLLPLLWTGRIAPGPGLAEESRGATVGPGRVRVRHALVIAQVAFALVLLVGSGLLVRTFQNLRDVDPGFDGSHTLTLRLALSGSILRAAGRTEEADDLARSRFMMDVVDRLERVPGVQRAAFAADLPLNGDEFYDYVAVEGALPAGLETANRTLRTFVGPDYFDVIGARMVSGRELTRLDFADQPRVVVVNRPFADLHFPDGDAIGRRLLQYHPAVDPTEDVWYTIVGVVENIREVSLIEAPEPTIYLPTVFLPDGDFAMWVSNMAALIRVAGDPLALATRARATILEFRPDVPINDVASIGQLTARSFQEVSFAMVLVLIAALVSVAIGLVGIYGAISYVVGLRSREFGLRIALGASGPLVRRSVLRQGGTIGLIGIAIGVAGSALAARVLASMLFGVTATEPLIYAAVAATLFLLVLGASLGPARRAARADPVETMRAG